MQVARADRKALPEDPEELRKFLWRRAQERDRAREMIDKPGKTDGDAKTPKDYRDTKESRRTLAKSHNEPRAKDKGKTKPYTVRHLTMEEWTARQGKTESRASVEQTTTENRPGERTTKEAPDTMDKSRTPEDEEPADTERESNKPAASGSPDTGPTNENRASEEQTTTEDRHDKRTSKEAPDTMDKSRTPEDEEPADTEHESKKLGTKTPAASGSPDTGPTNTNPDAKETTACQEKEEQATKVTDSETRTVTKTKSEEQAYTEHPPGDTESKKPTPAVYKTKGPAGGKETISGDETEEPSAMETKPDIKTGTEEPDREGKPPTDDPVPPKISDTKVPAMATEDEGSTLEGTTVTEDTRERPTPGSPGDTRDGTEEPVHTPSAVTQGTIAEPSTEEEDARDAVEAQPPPHPPQPPLPPQHTPPGKPPNQGDEPPLGGSPPKRFTQSRSTDTAEARSRGGKSKQLYKRNDS